MPTDALTAQQLDQQDPLAHFRDRFEITDPNLIYLDGNSLGRFPKATRPLINELMDDWTDRLIRIWGEKHFQIGSETGAKIAELIGAQPDEVIVAESTSVNLFKLVVAALRAQTGRHKIVTDDMNFPSDVYILDGVQDLLGDQHTVEIVPSADGIHAPADAIAATLDDDTALLTLTHTVFKSAYTYDIASMNQAARDAGALCIWDLSHSVGSVPIDLNGSNADMAVGCTYKYLNGGPGAPAFLYVRRDLQAKLRNPISGWMSQRNMFDFDLAYSPEVGINQFFTGTPNVLSILPINVGVDLLLEAGMKNVRKKSLAQTGFLIELWEEMLAPLGYTLKTPRDPQLRGSHVSLGHEEGWRISQCMIKEMNIIPDFRAPDNIRLGVTPLYTTFEELHTTAVRMAQIVREGLYEKYSVEKSTVT